MEFTDLHLLSVAENAHQLLGIVLTFSHAYLFAELFEVDFSVGANPIEIGGTE